MAGSSMDGLDCALCNFWNDGRWHFHIERAQTVPYPDGWKDWLGTLHMGAAQYLIEADRKYGVWVAEKVVEFLGTDTCGLIGLHGHTVFHQPERGISAQMGSADALYAQTGIPVVSDFRSLDIVLGGQGAPLVPLVDELLFSEFAACLNLGGIANISLMQNGQRIGYDICACNQLLNVVARLEGFDYDEGGAMAAEGQVLDRVLADLEAWPFLAQPIPKSLGREHIERDVLPLLRNRRGSSADLLRTICVHIARQVGRSAAGLAGKVLVTGGGTYNTTLCQEIKNQGVAIQVPHQILVDYKEAMAFGLLALRRALGETTTLASVTGASRASSGGRITGGRIIFL